MKCAPALLVLSFCMAGYAQTSRTVEAEPQGPEVVNPDSGTDFLILTGGLDHSSSGKRGGSGSFSWAHGNEKGRTYTAGLSTFSFDDSRWALGKGGAAFRAGTRVVLQGSANVGGGHSAGDRFAYQLYRGDATLKAISSLYLRFAQEYVRVDETRGFIVRPGIILVLPPLGTLDVEYAHSAWGNFGTEFVSTRLDVATRPIGFLGGFAAGRTVPETVNVVTGAPPRVDSLREGFFGVRLPLSQAEFTVVADLLDLAAVRRLSVTFSLKVPLQNQGSQRQ